MGHFRLLATVGIVGSLAACASGPTPEQIEDAYYGFEMTQEQCIGVAEAAISNALKDPDSAQFRTGACQKGWWNSVPIMGMPVEFGYMVNGEVNGKNSYGGYVGFQPYSALVRDGFIVRYCLSDNSGVCIPVEP